MLYWITDLPGGHGVGATTGAQPPRSFRSLPTALERFLATCGALEAAARSGSTGAGACNPPSHKFSDTDVDHHNSIAGFWWSHMGWMFPKPSPPPRVRAARLHRRSCSATPTNRWLHQFTSLLLQHPPGLCLFWIARSARRGWGPVLWGHPLAPGISEPLHLGCCELRQPTAGGRPRYPAATSRATTPGWLP